MAVEQPACAGFRPCCSGPCTPSQPPGLIRAVACRCGRGKMAADEEWEIARMKLPRRSLGRLLLSAASLIWLAGAAAAQEKGTVYYMIPTLLDEFQTESKKAVEG